MWASAPTFQPGSTLAMATSRPRIASEAARETNRRLNNLLYAAFLAGQRTSLWFFRTADYKSVEVAMRRTLNPTWNRI